jgi:hypothetical protein
VVLARLAIDHAMREPPKDCYEYLSIILQVQRSLYTEWFRSSRRTHPDFKGDCVNTVLTIGLLALVSGVSMLFLGLRSFRIAIRAGRCVALVIGGMLILWGLGLIGSVLG